MTAIIQYQAGNARSVLNALHRLGRQAIITDDPDIIRKADQVIFPGVGAAGPAMQYLQARALDQLIPTLTQPVLGICLGMQLLCRYSEEHDTSCMGVFDTTVRLFPPDDRVPHVGWNTLSGMQGPLFKNLHTGDDVYFVHSYFAEVCTQTTAITDYILPFSAALQRDNFFATQFHPEKSARTGSIILNNFLSL
jgi:imidazole glycerol-phosphate synthase subunit HisH